MSELHRTLGISLQNQLAVLMLLIAWILRNQCNSLEEIAPENYKMLKSCLADSFKHIY